MPIDTERLSLKILQTDKLALRRLARAQGESMSVLVRRILRDELRRHGLLKAESLIKEQQNEQSVKE